MTYLQSLETMPLAQAIGWALVHFIWQGALLALVLAGVLRLMRRRSANARYLVGCAGMLAMLAAPLVTMAFVWPGAAAPALAMPGLAGVEIPLTAWQRLEPLVPAFTVVWLAGVFVLQARLVLNWSHAQHLKNDGVRRAPAQWERTVETLSAQMGVGAAVRIVESTVAGVPMLIGWLRPVILVPTAAFTGLTPAQLRSIIAHELTHVRRHDYVVNLVQAVFETLLFYHPAVWWLSGRIRVEREYCCDDVAVGVCGDALCYAQALSTLEGMRSDERQPVLASTGGSLMDRIRRIAGVRSVPSRRLGGWIAPIVVAMSVTAAVSAMAVTATAREAAADDAEFNPLDRVNVVGILNEFRADQTELIAFLAEHGMDNRVLMAVLQELDADERVFQAVDRATEREAYVESQMPEARQWVADELAAGRLSMDQAREHLDMARREVRDRMRAEQRAERYREQRAQELELEEIDRRAVMEAVLAGVHQQLTGEVVEGRLSEEDARRALEVARDDVHVDGWLARQGAVDAEKRESLKARMQAFHEQLRSDLADGRIDETQAHERMKRAKDELQAVLERDQAVRERDRERTVHLREIEADRRMADMRQQGALIREQIDFAAAQGRTDEAEDAKRKLEQYEQAMAQLQRDIAVELRRADQTTPLREDLLGRGVTDETIERQLAKVRERPGLPLPAARPPAHRFDDVKRKLTAEVEAGRLSEADAKKKLAAVQRELARDYTERAARYRLTKQDRKALATGLDRARAQLDKQVAAGRLTEEQLAKRLARLAKLEQALEAEAKRRDRAARSVERRILEEKAQTEERLPEKKKPADQ